MENEMEGYVSLGTGKPVEAGNQLESYWKNTHSKDNDYTSTYHLMNPSCMLYAVLGKKQWAKKTYWIKSPRLGS